MNPFDPGSARRSNPRLRHSTPLGEAASPALACDAVEPDVVAYFDGEADDQAALRARRHLSACPSCARMWRDWGDARLLLRSARLPEMPVHWPASLVQRARLQALLPALFAPQTPLDAFEDAPQAAQASSAQPPRGLRDAILARTTRAAAFSSPGLNRAEADAPELSTFATLEPGGLSSSPGRRFRLLRRAAVPALAAWMLVLAAAPAPQAPSQPSAQPGQAARPQAQPGVALGLSRPATAQPPGAKRAVLAAQASASASAQFRPLGKTAPGFAAGSLGSASPAAAPPELASAAQGNAERESRAAALEAVVWEAAGAREEASPQLAAAFSERRAPAARESQPAPRRTALAASAVAPAAQPASNGLSPAASTSSRAEAASKSPQPAQAPLAQSQAKPGDPNARSLQAARNPEGPVEHEPLDVSRELNDARPAELGDAIDAYAATYVDENDASL